MHMAMKDQGWRIVFLLLGILCKPILAAGAESWPYWAIILVCLACIMVLFFLLCLICTISVLTCRRIRLRNTWIRSYFPHLAFWGDDAEAGRNVG